MKLHHYKTQLHWTGNQGSGTSSYSSYSRNHEVVVNGKPLLHLSSDPSFRGDPHRYNPEELLLASLSSCHMLWYLHLCAVAGIVVTHYADSAEGIMQENPDGSGAFTSVTLKPVVTIDNKNKLDEAKKLHHKAHHMCFISQSVRFTVHCEPDIIGG